MRQNKNPGIMKVVKKVKTMNLVRWLQTLYEEHMEIKRDRSYLRNIAKAEGWAEGIAEGRVTGIAEGIVEGRSLGQSEGRVEGIAIGEAIGDLRRLRQDIFDLLEELGEIPKDIRSHILSQKDTETLRGWLKAAARATDFDEFLGEDNINEE